MLLDNIFERKRKTEELISLIEYVLKPILILVRVPNLYVNNLSKY